MFKKWLAILLAVVMVCSMIPLSVFAAEKDIVTITVVDQFGNKLPNATITVSRTYLTVAGYRRTQNVTVTSNRDGTFTYDTSKYFSGTTQYYTATASCANCPTVTQQIDPDTRSVLITLTDTSAPQPDEWARFDVYYIATGITPESFTGAGQPQNYGPSGNDVPLVTINVNITKLKGAEYAHCVTYEENKNGNSYHFIPAGDIDGDDVTEEQKRKLIKPFWEAVVECMDDASKEACEATGLMGSFKEDENGNMVYEIGSYMSYVLKNQGSALNQDLHCDGILTVEPPVYIVEMNDRGTYFGGFANDKETSQYTKLTDVLTAYNNHFGQNINWISNGDGTYSGSYVEGKYQYYLKISQTNYSNNLYQPASGEEYVSYKKQNDQYYLATFDAETVMVEQIEFTVTYKDGANNKVFNAQVSPVKGGAPAPAFGGVVVRENYNHVGWMLEGGNGTVLSQQDILNTYKAVNQDLTFVAVYELKPATFAGVVEVVLNGTYENGVATGERVDITTVKGAAISLAVSADGVKFIPLTKSATGVYEAHLENGSYQIYYSNGKSYTLSSEQRLDISDAPRTRYLFFNTVEYDVNGGENGPVPAKEYYQTGTAVNVSTTVPTKDGYRFLGWKDQDGTLYQSGDRLTAAIGNAYTLTAQWEKILYADVDVTVILDHTAAGGGENSNFDKPLTIELTYRPVDSTEDYVEIVGDAYESTKTDWYTADATQNDVTTVTYESLFASLDIAHEYNANVFLSEYAVQERTVESVTDGEGNVTYHVTVKMKFTPEQFMLQYGIEERIDNDALVPSAVDIKVLTWYNPSNEIEGAPTYTLWYPIFEHVNSSHDALFTDKNAAGNQVGFGQYNVWGWENKDANLPYYYRIGTVGFTLADGTELTAVTEDGIHFTSVATDRYPEGAYTAVLEITGGNTPNGTDLYGAYFKNGVQNGELTLVIEAHPYTVTLDPNGGKLNGSENDTVIDDQFIVPNLDGYVPTRNDAHVFDKWVLLDENGKQTDETVTAGDALTRDITLVATWKAPLKIEGLVTVGATYEQQNKDGTYSVQTIHEADRAKTATILLQRVEPNGYTETVQSETLTLDYTNEGYYHHGTIVGFAMYSFANIPDDGTTYRIQMLLPNYHSFFQNEPESVDEWKDYPTYNDTDYIVEWGDTDPTVGTANIHNHFDPDEFELNYTVDASAIGDGFRPDSADIFITYEDDPTNKDDDTVTSYEPSEWAIISQMYINGQLIGNEVVLDESGIGHGSDSVWISNMSGVVYYQYGIRLHTVTTDGVTEIHPTGRPYTVTYEAPVHYHYGAQSEELKVILTPNTYAINYELGGGKAGGTYPTTHTWSHETALNLADPTFQGFEFGGWYLDPEFTEEAPASIAADVAEDTTLYAKWVQVMDVVDLTVIIKHEAENDGDLGLAGNYDKTLYAQLTRDLRSNDGQIDRVFADVNGFSKEYRNGVWHTQGDDVTQDIFQVPSFYTNLSADYDYSVNVSLDGYHVINKTVTKTAQPDGSTLHKVVIEMQYNPKLLMLNFYVKAEDNIELPVSAEVKVTCWYDSTREDVTDWQWFRITQHASSTVTVSIDPDTRIGEGNYPVWMWYNEEAGIPYHYRIEVVQLNFADGSSSHMAETQEDVMYHGGGYHAQIETSGGATPNIQGSTTSTTLEGVHGIVQDGAYVQQGKVGALIGNHNSVVFHANNADYTGVDAFRTYYYDHEPDDGYLLNADGSVDTFYDIPTFDYTTHNNYIFKGWYMHPVLEDEPFDWSHQFEGSDDVYAHWIRVDDVEQEDDGKTVANSTYHEYDLTGVQIRDQDIDEMNHWGNPASGLRFITVLSERVYDEINAITGVEAEYGFVMAKSTTLLSYADGDDYMLQYNGKNVNGVDTSEAYKYVQNVRCSSTADHIVPDHFNGEKYRLYTAVITYNGLEGTALDTAYATAFTARSYIRYEDANGLTRTYYNNYTGASKTAGGCNTSFATVQGMMGA